MFEATVVIPVGPGHERHVERAYASVQAQTVPVQIVVVRDPDGKGPSWARNRGIERVRTPYLVFLDADDELLPRYVELALDAARQVWPNQYIYTDWWEGQKRVQPAPRCWCGDGKWHTITSVLPTHWVLHIGGFDEEMVRGGEDIAFYWKLQHHGCCGQYLAEPLLRYHPSPNSRSIRWKNDPLHNQTMDAVMAKYGGLMPCCGQVNTKTNTVPLGEKQPGDVLAQVLWRNRKRWQGAATVRPYKRASWPDYLWVDPADIEAMPGQLRRVEAPPPPPLPPSFEEPEPEEMGPVSFAQLGNLLAGTGNHPPKFEPRHATPTGLGIAAVIARGQEVLSE